MAREETARVVRARIDALRKEREALIGKRQRLDDEMASRRQRLDDEMANRRQRLDAEVASVDTDIQNLEAVLQPTGASRRRSQHAPTAAAATADLVCELLATSGSPLHYDTIYERLRDEDPQPPRSGSKKPATAYLVRYYKDSRIYRPKPGYYALREPATSVENKETSHRGDNPSLTGKTPTGYTLLGTYYPVHKFKDILIGVCETLHDLDPVTFRKVLTAKSTHSQFSEDAESLWSPRPIGNSGIYVTSNMGADRMQGICQRVIHLFEFDNSEFAIEVE